MLLAISLCMGFFYIENGLQFVLLCSHMWQPWYLLLELKLPWLLAPDLPCNSFKQRSELASATESGMVTGVDTWGRVLWIVEWKWFLKYKLCCRPPSICGIYHWGWFYRSLIKSCYRGGWGWGRGMLVTKKSVDHNFACVKPVLHVVIFFQSNLCLEICENEKKDSYVPTYRTISMHRRWTRSYSSPSTYQWLPCLSPNERRGIYSFWEAWDFYSAI